MSGKYQAYPKYKDSVVEWLDKVPVHWTSVPIKYMALEKDSLFLDGDWIESKDLSDDGIRYITTGNVGEGEYKEQGAGYITEDKFHKIDCTEVFEGDVLISRLNSPIGRSCIVPNLGSRIVTSVDNVIFRPDQQYSKKYVVHLFSSQDYFKHTGNLARGATMQRISRGLLGNIRVVVPTFEEQEKIANFLDQETAKIDTLIEKQQRLIQLLKEKRQAVISHAVTKGLNPNAPMRDSGVEWLGKVPEHWQLIPLKYLCKFNGGGTPSKENLSYWTDGDIPWVSPKDMKSFCLSDTQDKLTEKAVKESSTNFVESGALLMVVRSGILQRTIPIAINTVRVTLNQDMKALRFNSQMDVEYAANFILGCEDSLLLEWSKEGATVESIEHEYLSNGLFPVPPIKEQEKINESIKERMKVFQSLEKHATRGIALLQERRTALISAAITGKIDVRHWKASLNEANMEIMETAL
jgi:type I restriction enzyme S subunit